MSKDHSIELIARGVFVRGGAVLLCQNVKHGYYYLPGGHVEFGEAAAVALAREIDDAKAQGLLLSLHLKATMMKVSDPILFGHAVKIYYAEVFEKHAATFEALGVAVAEDLLGQGAGELLAAAYA